MHRRRADGVEPSIKLRTASLAFLVCALCLGGGFFAGYYVGQNVGVVGFKQSGTGGGERTAPSQEKIQALQSAESSPVTTSLSQLQPVSWPLEDPAQPPMCLDTCPMARNGVCDEGRRLQDGGQHELVLCDLGTDCADCGEWKPTTADVPWQKHGYGGPISRLLERKVEVRVKRASLKPLDFVFAYTDPSKDVDVSEWMNSNGYIEADITQVFYKIFEKGCHPPGKPSERGLFVDVGANFGWYSLIAASMGCRVVAFEPVPDFHAFLEYNLHLNGMAHLVSVQHLIVSAQSGTNLSMTVPSHGIWGTAGIGGLNIDHNIKGTHEIISVPSIRLEELIKQDVLLVKMDVEGWEFSVLGGAAKLLGQHHVDNIILEYSPGVHERHGKMDELRLTTLMLSRLLEHGYSLAHIQDQGPSYINREGTDCETHLSKALPPMMEVTAENVRYELADNDHQKAGQLGCPVHEDVRAANPQAWDMCNGTPEDLNPRSLRSVMGHNTNLWASRKRDSMTLAGPVGLLPLTAPSTQYFRPPPLSLH